MGKEFGDLFSESWNEYKNNFGLILKIFLFLSILPFIIFGVTGLLIDAPILTDDAGFSEVASAFSDYLIYFIVVILISVVLYFIMMAAYLYISIYKKPNTQMSFWQAVKGGMGFFWKYVWLVILLIILLIPLFLLLIIPGIIFVVYWTFASYVLFEGKSSAWESMKASKALVKGRWWGVFGYGLLFGLIMILINIPFWILAFLASLPGSEVFILLSEFFGSLVQLITTPLMVLFFKNFYFDLKANKPKSK